MFAKAMVSVTEANPLFAELIRTSGTRPVEFLQVPGGSRRQDRAGVFHRDQSKDADFISAIEKELAVAR